MEKTEITILNIVVTRIKGEKDGKEYDFLTYHFPLENGNKIDFAPFKNDKKLLEYMIKEKFER